MISSWPRQLEEIIAQRCSLLRRVLVLRETDSTQSAARRLDARSGDVIVALRQTAGRGRLARAWADTGEDGVAATVVAPRGEPERLAIAAAVGVAKAAQIVLENAIIVGIKWPNDIVVPPQCRKLAGILIEQTAQIALIGIGVNVSQQSWPAELQERAVSMAQLGAACDRLEVLAALLPELDAALRMDDAQLVKEFAQRDVLRGTAARFRCGARTIAGRVIDVDPMRGLSVHDGSTEHWLPAATTTLREVDE